MNPSSIAGIRWMVGLIVAVGAISVTAAVSVVRERLAASPITSATFGQEDFAPKAPAPARADVRAVAMKPAERRADTAIE